ncbi:MAG: PAS domain S-box protein [Desulfobacterales bacterium]|nr:PAS domain S-box protein [Desulfobacterales bacterium]
MAPKPTEESLEQAKILEELFNQVADGICVCHNIPDAPYVKFTSWNPKMSDITEYAMDEINRLGWYQTMYPDPEVQKRAIERMASMRDGVDIQAEEWTITTKNGERKTLSISTSIVKKENEKTHILAIMRDISEQIRTRTALRESEEKYRGVVENANEGITVAQEGMVRFINQKMSEITGYGRDEVLCRPFMDFVHPDDQQMAKQYNIKRFQGEEIPETYILRIITKDGDIKWLENNGVVTTWEGRPASLHCFTDITDRKHLEKTLQLHSVIMANLAEGVYLIRAGDGEILYANPRFEEMFGYGPGELIGKNVSVVNAPTERSPEETAQEIIESLNKNKEWSGEIKSIKKDGTHFWCYASVTKFDHPDYGTVWVSAHTDITERKKTEEALRESEEKYREMYSQGEQQNKTLTTLFSISQTVNQSLALDQILNDALDQVMELFKPHSTSVRLLDTQTQELVFAAQKGHAPHELELLAKSTKLGQSTASIVLKPDDVLVIEDILTHPRTANRKGFAARTGARGLAVIPLYAKDKLQGNMTMGSIEPRAYTAEEIRLFVSIGHQIGTAIENARLYQDKEVTIQKLNEAQEHLKKSNEALRITMAEREKMKEELLTAQKLESLGILAGGIAHDFNNLLTVILGYISLAKDSESKDDIIEFLTEAENASLKSKELTHQLITFSKGGAPVKKTAPILEFVKESVNFALSGSNVRCEFFLPEDLWQVEYDEDQIKHVINSLTINALEAMPEGGIIKLFAENLVIKREKEESEFRLQKGRYVKISIQDQGSGISAENLPKIFDPYFSTKDRGIQKGMGLGLSAVYSIIRHHNGRIVVDSKKGVGTTCHIYLPASEKTALKPEKKEEQPDKGRGRILFMDDMEMLRNMAGKMLKQLGYEVEVAADGAEAVEMYKAAKESDKPFNAVILDLTIPGGMGGKEAIEKLFKIDPEVKAIVSSGYSNDPAMSNFKAYGFSGVVPKPFEMKEMEKVLHEVLRGESN